MKPLNILMKRCLLIFTLAIAITACQKKPVTPATAATPAFDFLPLTPGNTWTYGIKGWADADGNFYRLCSFYCYQQAKNI
jgi:hypothetical protein